MRLLLLIIGLVLGSYILFTALAKSRLKKYARFQEDFDRTVMENAHGLVKPAEKVDPLLDMDANEYLVHQERAKARVAASYQAQEPYPHSVPNTPYAWEAALAEEEAQEEAALAHLEDLEEEETSAQSEDFATRDIEEWEEETHPSWEAEKEEAQYQLPPPPAASDFIALTLLPRNRMGFSGHTLLSALKVNYFHYSKQKTFNRHLGDDPNQPVLFSVVSLIEPGVFEQNQMSRSLFPGLVIFMLLPCATNAMTTFEKMFTTARQLADSLNAELCDMSRKPLTIQTLGQYRDRIHANEYRYANEA